MGKKRGAKSKYETLVKPKLNKIKEKVRKGVTEEEIAKGLGISVASLNNYRNQYPEFAEALSKDKGEDVLNDLINAGIEAAIGGVKKVKKPVVLKRKIYENGKLAAVEEYIEFVDTEEYIPTNAALNQFYVCNYGKKKGFARDPQAHELNKRKLELDEQVTKKKNWQLNLDEYK